MQLFLKPVTKAGGEFSQQPQREPSSYQPILLPREGFSGSIYALNSKPVPERGKTRTRLFYAKSNLHFHCKSSTLAQDGIISLTFPWSPFPFSLVPSLGTRAGQAVREGELSSPAREFRSRGAIC